MRSRARMTALGTAVLTMVALPAAALPAAADETGTAPLTGTPVTVQEKIAWVKQYRLAHVAKASVIARGSEATTLRLKVQVPRCWRLLSTWVSEERGAAYVAVTTEAGNRCTVTRENTLKTRAWVIRVSRDVTHIADFSGELVAANIR